MLCSSASWRLSALIDCLGNLLQSLVAENGVAAEQALLHMRPLLLELQIEGGFENEL